MIIRSRLPERISLIVFQGIGLFTLSLGVSLAIKTQNFLLLIFSIVLGSIIGELLDLEKVNHLGENLKSLIKSKNDRFAEGLVTAFLLFCMGSMTILGAIEKAWTSPHLLLAKSVLDGFSSIALSASLGAGVIFSIIPLLLLPGWNNFICQFSSKFFYRFPDTELTQQGDCSYRSRN